MCSSHLSLNAEVTGLPHLTRFLSSASLHPLLSASVLYWFAHLYNMLSRVSLQRRPWWRLSVRLGRRNTVSSNQHRPDETLSQKAKQTRKKKGFWCQELNHQFSGSARARHSWLTATPPPHPQPPCSSPSPGMWGGNSGPQLSSGWWNASSPLSSLVKTRLQ